MKRILSRKGILCLTGSLQIFLATSACTSTSKKESAKQPSEAPPKLLAPSVRKTWVPAQMKDGGLEWEEGHFIYRIERGTTWSR